MVDLTSYIPIKLFNLKSYFMKKAYLLPILGLFLPCVLASQTVNKGIAQETNTIFGPLEKNRIPHHILLDYGIEFIDISKYDGILRSENYLSVVTHKDIYNTIVSSRTSTSAAGIYSPIAEETEWSTLQRQANNNNDETANIVLSGLYFHYSKIKSDALSNNKIQVNNDTYDDKYINGVWQNPYETKTAFSISSSIQEIKQSDVSVYLPTSLWYTNQSTSIGAIQIDFGNGTGYKNISNQNSASTYYNNPGVYTWTYRIQLTSGQYKYCRQKVNVTIEPQSKVSSNCPNLDFEAITAVKSYQGVYGSATLQIAYGSSDCKLRKPLIVAEGLDTGLLAASGTIGDSDIIKFMEEVNSSESTDLRNLVTNNTSIDYDIVYVNWNNGVDYIQRNAYVLEEVIDWVNQEKIANGSSAPNVILGQSMGGVIARYALRDMENNNEDHDTELYISHDAPHQGAHVPLGFLYMTRHLLDQFISTPVGSISIPVSSGNVGLTDLEDLLDAPAVQQLLINNVDSNVNWDNTAYIAWQNELKNMGYPQQTRNISVSNANHCAQLQQVSPKQRLLSLNANGRTSFLTDFILTLNGFNNLSGNQRGG